MTQRWRDLLFLHMAVAPEVARQAVPKPLEIDTFRNQEGEEEAWIGLVPFRMEGVRPVGVPPIPGLSAFPETNVRTYVHMNGVPGVWFFSLDAASGVACRVARRFFHLPYHEARMTATRSGERVAYSSTRRRGAGAVEVQAEVLGDARVAEPGSLEFFLVERYRLYCTDGRGWFAGNVHHAPYQTRNARVLHCQESLMAMASLPPGAFTHHLFSEGVDVQVGPLAPLAV